MYSLCTCMRIARNILPHCAKTRPAFRPSPVCISKPRKTPFALRPFRYYPPASSACQARRSLCAHGNLHTGSCYLGPVCNILYWLDISACARSSVDRVFDSDSKDRGFESRRVRQSRGSFGDPGIFYAQGIRTGAVPKGSQPACGRLAAPRRDRPQAGANPAGRAPLNAFPLKHILRTDPCAAQRHAFVCGCSRPPLMVYCPYPP